MKLKLKIEIDVIYELANTSDRNIRVCTEGARKFCVFWRSLAPMCIFLRYSTLSAIVWILVTVQSAAPVDLADLSPHFGLMCSRCYCLTMVWFITGYDYYSHVCFQDLGHVIILKSPHTVFIDCWVQCNIKMNSFVCLALERVTQASSTTTSTTYEIYCLLLNLWLGLSQRGVRTGLIFYTKRLLSRT